MTDERKLTSAEADQILARAASLDAESEDHTLSAEEIRSSALAAGIAPHAVERALKEARSPAPVATTESGRFMGLMAVQRAGASVQGGPKLTSKEIAGRLRMLVGPDATISEELGTVRARYRDLVVTVMPGASTTIAVVSDQAGIVATTAITLGAVGFVVGSIVGAMFGFATPFLGVAFGVLFGIGAGLALWRWHWRRELARKGREIETLASAVVASLHGG
jgi:hypothetical protein